MGLAGAAAGALLSEVAGLLSPPAACAAGLASLFSLDVAVPSPLAPLVAPSLPDSAFGLSTGFAPEFLKSVAYQPLPLSWNPTAEMSLTRLSLPHDGQTSMGESASRCNASRR